MSSGSLEVTKMGSHPLSWTSSSPGHWTRPLDPLEKYEFYIINSTPSIFQRSVVTGATLSTIPSIDSIKSAWRALRYAHPILGASITLEGYSFHLRSSEEIDEWVDSTVKVIETDQDPKNVSANIRAPESAELYFLPLSSSIFLNIRHELLDATGSLMLLNSFLKYLSSPPLEEQIDSESRLSISLSEALNIGPASPELISHISSIMTKFLASPSISLPLKPSLSDYECVRYEHAFSTSQTTSLLSSCKSRDLTITHILVASIALSLLKVNGLESGEFTGSLPISLRSTLPEPYNTPAHATMLCITGPLSVTPLMSSTPFFPLAQHFKEVYHNWKSYKDAVTTHASQAEVIEGLIKSHGGNISGKGTVTVSSLGILERYVDFNGVEEVWTGMATAVPKVMVVMYTVKGRLRIEAWFNKRFHEEKLIGEFLDTAVSRMLSELEVE